MDALAKAKAENVDADVEAAVRNNSQLTRTWLWAAVVTVPLTLINALLLGHKVDLQTTWAALALAAGQVGGLYALRRSNETRSYLGEVQLVLHEMSARSILASAIAHSRDIRECGDMAVLRDRATAILQQLRDSRLFPKTVDAFSVWARDDHARVWRMVAALGATQKTLEEFTQPLVETENSGAGVVANLAAQADKYTNYYQRSAQDAPNRWFKQDPNRRSETETLAVFLLPDEEGKPIGAFALTSPQQDALEIGSGEMSDRTQLIVDQCSITLVGVARRAHDLWLKGRAK